MDVFNVESYNGHARFLRRFCMILTKIMQDSCKGTARILQRSCKIPAKVLQESYKDHARFLQVLQDSCEDLARNVRKTSKFRQDSCLNLTRFQQESFKNLVMKLHDISTWVSTC